MKIVTLGFISLLIAFNLAAQSGPTIITTKTEKDVIPEGIAVDAASGTIYVSSIFLKKIIAIYNDGSKSYVHAFDIKTGVVKQKYELKDTRRHLLNDLILHPEGRIYITDTYDSSVYELEAVIVYELK